MRIVIAGCGRVGSTLAGWLADDGHDVTVVDRSEHALETLGKSFNGAKLLGQAYDVDVLREAGLESADVFLAVTDSDNANLMAVELAKSVFGIKRSIARLYDPAREETYRALGVQHITGTKLLANVFYEQTVEEQFTYHVGFTEGDVEIVEFRIAPDVRELTVGEFEVTSKLRVAAVQRGHYTHIPGRRFALQPGDLVVAAARAGVRPRIAHYVEEPA